MSGAAGHPALRLLLRLKLRGTVRKHLRRMRTVSGLLLTLIGAGLFLLWIGSLILHWIFEPGPPADPAELRPLVSLGGLALLFLTLSSSLSHRGLFVPREEITVQECTDAEIAILREAKANFFREKATHRVTTPHGLPYSPHYLRESKARKS